MPTGIYTRKPFTLEHRQNIKKGLDRRGGVWNKGKIDVYTDETLKIMSERKQGVNHWRYNLDRTSYYVLHQWVREQLGKPSVCENCGTIQAKRYDWANLSGKYLKELSDWARLCHRCHALIDGFGLYMRERKHASSHS